MKVRRRRMVCAGEIGDSRERGRLGGSTPRQSQRQAGRQTGTTTTLAGMVKAKRAYSREFTPQTERRVQFLIDRVPPTLLAAVKAKAKRDGVSLRTLTLRLWTEWLGR
jgi:hypothetical protein